MASRKGSTQVATDTAPATEAAPAEGTTEAKPKRERKINGVYVSTPDQLRAALEAEATEKQTSVATLVRDMLAAHFNITLPDAPAPRRKYASDEERKAAQTQARKDKQALVKKLLQEYQARMAAEAKGEAVAA